MPRIAILGPGLLGGSLALKLRGVALWARRESALAELRASGCADLVSTDAAAVVRDADVVVLCVPVDAMPALAREIAPHLREGAVVTDVGSVKARVVAELGAILGGRFVGAHPMAGTQHTGFGAAFAELFDDTTCIVTPGAASDLAVGKVRDFWKAVGCRVVEMSPAEHDECVALVSHLPHAIAGTLVRTVAALNPRAFDVVGPGFRDTTRVASGPPELWMGILRENSTAVAAALDAMIAKLAELRHTLAPFDEAGLRALLAQARDTRERITFPQ